jgi:hypothetical protein
MTDMDINARESGHLLRQWKRFRALADSMKQPTDSGSAFDAKAGRCRGDGAGNDAAHGDGGTCKRPPQLLVSGRGAIVAVLIALFLTVARGQPSTVLPTRASGIGTIEPASYDRSAVWRGQASAAVEVNLRPDTGHKDIEIAAAIAMNHGSPRK